MYSASSNRHRHKYTEGRGRKYGILPQRGSDSSSGSGHHIIKVAAIVARTEVEFVFGGGKPRGKLGPMRGQRNGKGKGGKPIDKTRKGQNGISDRSRSTSAESPMKQRSEPTDIKSLRDARCRDGRAETPGLAQMNTGLSEHTRETQL